MSLDWHYGPTDRDPDPQSMWHLGCGGRVSLHEDDGDPTLVCGKCGRTAPIEEPEADLPADVDGLPEDMASYAWGGPNEGLGPDGLPLEGDEPEPEGDEPEPEGDEPEVLEGDGRRNNGASAEHMAELGSRPRPEVRRNYDWPAIRVRYVLGFVDGEKQCWPTLQEVADHFERPVNRIREKSASEGWVAQRQTHQAELERRAAEAKIAKFAAAGERLDASALSAAEFGMQLCQARLVEIAEAHRTAKTQGEGSDGGYSRIDARELELLGRAADMFHRLGMRSLGDVETQRMEITGANGQAIHLTAELHRDDPARLAGVLTVLERAGFGELLPNLVGGEGREPGGRPALEAGS